MRAPTGLGTDRGDNQDNLVPDSATESIKRVPHANCRLAHTKARAYQASVRRLAVPQPFQYTFLVVAR